MMTRQQLALLGAVKATLLVVLASCHKQCKQPVQADYPAEMSAYVFPMRHSAWWSFTNNQGATDSLFVAAFHENLQSGKEEQDGECLYLPLRTFKITSARHGAGFLDAAYEMESRDAALMRITAEIAGTRTALSAGFHATEGFSFVEMQDTMINGTARPALILSSSDTRPNALNAIVLVKDVGIAAYTKGSENFMLTNFHVP